MYLALLLVVAGEAAISDGRSDEVGQGQDHVSAVTHADTKEAVKVDADMDAMIDQVLMFDEKHVPDTKKIFALGRKKVDLKVAASRLASQLPVDVASLVKVSVEGKAEPVFAEDSLQKARKTLNKLIEKSWEELDEKKINCWEYHDKNRRTFDQTNTDIARLAQQIADLEKLKSETIEMINVKEREILSTTGRLKKEMAQCLKIKMENERDMTIRKNDLAVFQFMMQLTKCKTASFTQVGKGAHSSQTKICETHQGLVLDFGDRKAQEKLERMMTPSARSAVRDLLQSVLTLQKTSFLQRGDHEESDDAGDEDESDADPATTATSTTTVGYPTPSVKSIKVKVEKRVSQKTGWYKCPKGPPDCGLLHDKMSLLWGQYKDLVDELQQIMDKNEFECMELEENLNAQIEIYRNSKAKFIEKLNEVTGSLNADREEMSEKLEERSELESDYRSYMKKCKKRIAWIWLQDLCSYLSLRATVMKFSKTSPPEKIVDCEVADWMPETCTKECDDKCPNKQDPYACGGWQTIARDVINAPNEFGLACPFLTTKRKCNQVKCPQDCVMSKWSSWGECSTDCNGGVQGRTRSVMLQADNGGMSCNTAQESRPCGSGCCNCDCRLKRFSKWSPCSVACNGGFQERWRRVKVMQRGTGTCPKSDSRKRYRTRRCNTHDCNGDEICIARQDLIMAIDGSGSVQKYGFGVLKNFVAKLLDRYMGVYYGHEDMKIGVVQFGNGEVMSDNTVSRAETVIGMTSDMAKVKSAVEAMEFKKGFTNMAQAFTLAENLLLLEGRKEAQSAVMTLTDGKPSFLFQTYEKVQQLKDKHVKLFFVPITEFQGSEFALMKKWASSPWKTHLVHVPGMDILESDPEVYTQRIIVEFCPNAISPSATASTAPNAEPYLLIYEEGLCGDKGPYLKKDRTPCGAADCSALASGAGYTSFLLGIRGARGRCRAMKLKVTPDVVAAFEKEKRNPACPSGAWKKSKLFDFYINIPLA